MSDDDKNKDTDTEYKGTGKWNSAIGRGTTEGAIAGAVGAAVGAGIGALAGKGKDVKGAGALIGASIGGGVANLAGFVHGAYRGSANAGAGKEQVKELATQLTEQKNFVAKLTEEKAKSHDGGRGGPAA